MTDASDRRTLTFSQAEGLVQLPGQLQPKVLSREVRALLWQAVYVSMVECRGTAASAYGSVYVLNGNWLNILLEKWVQVDHRMIDEFNRQFDYWSGSLKQIISNHSYALVFDLLEFVLRNEHAPNDLSDEIGRALIKGRAAYRLIDGDVFVPLAVEGEIAAVSAAFADVAQAEFHGARAHLRASAEALTRGDFAGSVRESIHAVDGVARSLAPEATDLAPALNALERAGYIHAAMKSGFSKLYGYTSNEKGIRHALIADDAARVTEVDAIYMLGSCSAFVSYLIGKARELGVALN